MGIAQATRPGVAGVMESSQTIPTEIRRFLAQVVSRRRRTALLQAAALSITFAILWMLCWAMVDRLLAMPAWARVVIDIVNIVGTTALLVRPVFNLLFARSDWRAAAALVESRRPEFHQQLLTVTAQLL